MEEYQNGDERRITVRLLAYWERRRAGRLMPLESEISPADIADLWGNCFIVHTKDIAKSDFHYSYLGKELRDLYEMGQHEGEEALYSFPDIRSISKEYKKVIEGVKPLVSENVLTTPNGDSFKYRFVLLPLGKGNNVEAIFGGMRFLRIVSYK